MMDFVGKVSSHIHWPETYSIIKPSRGSQNQERINAITDRGIVLSGILN